MNLRMLEVKLSHEDLMEIDAFLRHLFILVGSTEVIQKNVLFLKASVSLLSFLLSLTTVL